MIYPQSTSAPAPNDALPPEIRLDYDEARSICDLSPRGAAALLRLAIQKLCKELGGKGKRIDDDIAAFVKQGLDPQVQQALDIVRVVGNNAVHPGEIDLRDNRQIAIALFSIVNEIVEAMIARPNRIAALYEQLPQGDLDAIERRNAKVLGTGSPPTQER